MKVWCAVFCFSLAGCTAQGVHRYYATRANLPEPFMTQERLSVERAFERICVEHGLVRAGAPQGMIVYSVTQGSFNRVVLEIRDFGVAMVVFEGAPSGEWDTLRAELVKMLKRELPGAKIEYHEEGPSLFS